MHSYLECVQSDIADCTDNSASDEYALNMVKSYCSKGTATRLTCVELTPSTHQPTDRLL